MNKAEWVRKQNEDFARVNGISMSALSATYDIMRKEHRKEPVNRTFTPSSTCGFCICTRNKKGKTIVHLISLRHNKRGVAICQNDKDEFDPRVGLAIAWARYKNENIWTVVQLRNLTAGQLFKFNGEKDVYEFMGISKTQRSFACAICVNNGYITRIHNLSEEVILV